MKWEQNGRRGVAPADSGVVDDSGVVGDGQVAGGVVTAFPGAEGSGARAQGGRGGTVCEVTTLAITILTSNP
jgi:hypothetical protein